MKFIQYHTMASSEGQAPIDEPVSRRFFIKSLGTAGGLMLGCAALPVAAQATARAEASVLSGAELIFNAFLKITPDSQVIVVVKHLDMGQGVSTGLTTLVAEELDADWEQVSWEPAPADVSRYNNLVFGPAQGTGGSTAIANSWEQMRKAGAAARAMLVEAAARQWQVPAEEVRVVKGVVSHGKNTASFGELAPNAANLPVPESPALKAPENFTLIGRTIPRQDSFEKTNGSALYTQDVYLPGMLTAVVLYPPKMFGKVKKVDAGKARAVSGVVDIVEIPRGVAVLAEGFWPAYKARQLLQVDWDLSACETRDSEELFAHFSDTARKSGTVVRDDGDISAALETGAKVVEAEYRLPYLAHATIEPMNCVVQVKENGCELWYGCQMQTMDQHQIGAVTGHKPEQVRINTLYAGGSFGRRAAPDDYVLDAVTIANQVKGRPVKMVWTREDDIQNGRFRPMAVHRVRGVLSGEGKLLGWEHHAVAQPILRGTPIEGIIEGPIDNTLIEGITDMPYAIPNLHVQATEMEVGISTLWWRSVGHSGNAFVVEAFIDQLARAAGGDPVDFRRNLLAEHPRYLGVLNLAAEKANWGSSLPAGRGRGIAVHKAMGSWCAQVAEVTVEDNGSFSVDRIVCAIDCGLAVNPDVVSAQMEGGIGMALSALRGEEITLREGRVAQTNFHDYSVMRIGDMPKVEVHIVPSAIAPSGVGEPCVPPVAGAVVNALANATGQAATQLPLRTVST